MDRWNSIIWRRMLFFHSLLVLHIVWSNISFLVWIMTAHDRHRIGASRAIQFVMGMYVEVRPSGQIIHCWKETLSAITKRLEVFSVIYPMSNGHMRARINIHLFFSCIFVFRSSNDLYASICRNLKRVSCTLLHLFFVRFHLRFKRALHSCTHKHIFISIFFACIAQKTRLFGIWIRIYTSVCKLWCENRKRAYSGTEHKLPHIISMHTCL